MVKVLLYIIVTSYFFIGCHGGTLPSGQQTEQTLINLLLNGYNKNIRPDDVVSVDITAALQQIISIDDKQQIMTSSSIIYQTWFDDRLLWTRSTYNDIEVVMLPVKSLWIPDTFILNSADTTGYFTVSDYSLASVYYTGQVYLISPALSIRTRCNLVAVKFPFDQQTCSINLTSWAQGVNRINYTEDTKLVIDTSGYTEHPLWQLQGTDMIVYHGSDRAPFEDTFNDVISIQLFLKRKPLFFIMNGIFACLVLNCVTLLSFSLPFGTQVSLCMVCFMTYSVYSLSFSGIFPQQSQYIMMITLFFLLSILWTLVSLAWFVVCNHYTSKGEMPRTLYLFCGRLQKILFCCFPPAKPADDAKQKKDVVVETGVLKKSTNEETMIVTNAPKTRCVSCRNLFTPCLKRRVKVETVSTTQNGVVEDEASAKTDLVDSKPADPADIKTTDSTDIKSTETPVDASSSEPKVAPVSKCNFCHRCETCQADFDKDKTKGKNKKDIEARCNALNYLVFLCVLILILVSNLALWLVMAS